MTRPSTRARIDWGAARAFFVAMDPPRTYSAVAARFHVSVTAVRTHARAEEWAQIAADADAKAAEKALAGAVKTREQRVAQTIRIQDKLLDFFEVNLDAKAADATFTDLERMAKLVELLTGEATDRWSSSDMQGMLVVVLKAGPELLAELAESGLKGDALRRAFQERFAGVVRDRIAISGGEQ